MGWAGGRPITQLIVICLLALLAFTALVIVRRRSLFATVMLTGIYSFLGAGWMLLLDAPDVAFTEASVGAGISTVLMLSALSLIGQRQKVSSRPRSWGPLLVVAATGSALVLATLDMPLYGVADAPAHTHIAPEYLNDSVPTSGGESLRVGIPNIVTSVLASYRGYDTLGETTVIFTAAIAVLLMLLRGDGSRTIVEQTMVQQTVLRVVVKRLIPFILLFALYVQFHGDYGPGGGFQAGVIVAAGFILFELIFGLGEAQRVAPPAAIELLIAVGLLLYTGVGVVAMVRGGQFLEYGVLAHDPTHGQHLGILLVELGVGITVAASMIGFYFAFAGRRRIP